MQAGKKNVVLLCVDGSTNSEKALNWYHDTLYKKGDEVALVHVHVQPPFPAVGFGGGGFAALQMHKDDVQKSVEESKKVMEKYKKLCEEKNIPAKCHMQTMKHSVGQTICNVAKEEGASQIVVGKRGLGLVRRTLLGSVSDYILHHTHVPTSIVSNYTDSVEK